MAATKQVKEKKQPFKIKKKALKVRTPLLADEKYTGSEPIWPDNASSWTDEVFNSYLRKSFYFYNYYYSQKDLKKHVEAWAEKSAIFSKDEVKLFKQASDKKLSITACSLVMANKAGMPFKDRHIKYLTQIVKKCIIDAGLIDENEITKPATSVIAKPTIQDRLAEKTSELIGEMEGVFDDITKNKKPVFKPYDFLVSSKVPQTQISKFLEVFSNYKLEFEAAYNKTDKYLVEAYHQFKPQDFKRIIDWLNLVLLSLDEYKTVKKATKKARVKKAPSREKLVAKLKYAKDNKELKLVSINPAEIVGANELWCYNIKTRKLGKYVAEIHCQLSVKGTSILHFDVSKSVCKTLRKPAEKLKEFARAGKVQLRKFLEEIKATETKMNGRINSDTILLKVS